MDNDLEAIGTNAHELPMVAAALADNDAELPKINMKNVLGKLPKIVEDKSAFHQKKAKNVKVNVKVRHKDKMFEKYGKPKTRGQKKKK